MKIQEKTNLADLTTIKLGGEAAHFVSCSSVEQIQEALEYAKENSLKTYILAGGSIGFLFGYALSKINLKEESNLSLIPKMDSDTYGLDMKINFWFIYLKAQLFREAGYRVVCNDYQCIKTESFPIPLEWGDSNNCFLLKKKTFDTNNEP